MNPQINFIISGEKEKQLFNYFAEKCNLGIFPAYFINEDYSFDLDSDICDCKYLLVPKFHIKNLKIEKCNNSYSNNFKNTFCLMDDQLVSNPIIEYERFKFEKYYRIYANTFAMCFENKKEIEKIIFKIRNWFKVHATKKIIDGINVYVVS